MWREKNIVSNYYQKHKFLSKQIQKCISLWGKFTFEFLLFNKFIIHEPLLYHSSIYSIKCREPSLFIFQTFVYKRNTSRNKLERKTWVERSEAGNLVERGIGQYPQFVDSAWKQRGKKNTENEYFHGLVWKMIRNRKIKEIGMLKILRSPPIYLSPHRVSRPDAFFSFKFEAISSTYTVDQIHIWRNDFDVHSYAISTIFFPPLLFSISFFDYPTLVSPMLVFFLLPIKHTCLFMEDIPRGRSSRNGTQFFAINALEMRYYITNFWEIRYGTAIV